MGSTTVTNVNGLAVGSGTDYIVTLSPAGEGAPMAAQLVERMRINQRPLIDAIMHTARRVPFIIYLKPGAVTTEVAFRTSVNRYLTPFQDGPITVQATHADGSTPLTAPVYIENLVPTGYNAFKGVFVFTEGHWKGDFLSTDATPASVTTVGEYPALPLLEITSSGSTLARRRVTITDNCGRGLSNYPVLITFDSQSYSAAAAADYIVFYAGRPVPFKVISPNNASTKIWVRIDCPPSGSVTLDIYYGSAINNTITADAYDDGGMDLSNSSNTSWQWNEPFTISTNPRGACGVWVATRTGNAISGVSFGILDEAAAEFNIQLAPNATYPNDIDGAVLTVGTGAASSNALTNLSRDNVSVTGSGDRIRVRYRTANQIGLTTANTHSGGAAETGAISVPGAVEIVLCVDATQTGITSTGEFKLAGGSNLTLALDSSLTPTVSVGSAVAAELIDGTLTNTTTGDTITFDDIYLDEAATLSIDCGHANPQTITVDTGPLYTGGNGILPSNPATWFELAIGANACTLPSGVAMTVKWYNRYFA